MLAAIIVLASSSSPAALESLSIDGVDVDVFTPSSKVVGDVLVLPGWDSTRQNWCSGGRGLCDEAEKRGMRLVMPELGKSVYAWDVYAETKPAFRTPPTRRVSASWLSRPHEHLDRKADESWPTARPPKLNSQSWRCRDTRAGLRQLDETSPHWAGCPTTDRPRPARPPPIRAG